LGRVSPRISASFETPTMVSRSCSPGMRMGGMDRASQPRRKRTTNQSAPPRGTSTPALGGAPGEAYASRFCAAKTLSLSINCRSPARGARPRTRTLTKSESSPCSSIHCRISSLLVNLQVRESMVRVIQRPRSDPNTTRKNFPLFLVGLPQAKMKGSPSVNPPSATSQILSGIADASSNRYQLEESAACWPAKASEFSSRQVCADTNQDSGAAFARIRSLPTSNQCAVIERFVQVWMVAQVFVWSCTKVLAVTVPRLCGRVDRSQSVSQAEMTVLPMPWPDEAANLIGSTGSMPLKPRLATSPPISTRTSRCQSSGPVWSFSGPGSPQG